MADDIVERPCAECKGTGVAEVIGGYERGCDACFGEGVQRFTTMEAGLLDQCEALEADNARLRSALKEREEALERLGSSETMTTSFLRRNNAEGRELLARMNYARASLNKDQEG